MKTASEQHDSSGVQHILRRRKQLERDLEYITQEMYKRNLTLAETNRTLSLLQTIDSLALQSQDSLDIICTQVAQSITKTTNFPFVAVLSNRGATANLVVRGVSVNEDMVSPITDDIFQNLSIDISVLLDGEKSKLVSFNDTSAQVIRKVLRCTLSLAESIKEQAVVKSLYVVKLTSQQRLVGAIAVGFLSDASGVSEQDVQLIDRLSESIGVALDNRMLFEENQRVMLQLRRTNEKLKALDETKDDFISMASHQLRTPLTSVKGYLSLVLDGDAGPIKPTQRELLNQAFTSSQRMVYLISDLLNVSRLRTGKFIIDAHPINLAEIIVDEIAQLKESISTRSLELTYNKPANFPILMFDETKTRQVIMNFVDNAIYYTPAGGHIRVEVHDLPKTVELRVIDDGIGVPAAEQHHLFTKFYRAGNARKTRPDGTGLGLFMAKKVVIAQGGTLIFESKEGKGSTFGFSFSKAKLLPPATPSL